MKALMIYSANFKMYRLHVMYQLMYQGRHFLEHKFYAYHNFCSISRKLIPVKNTFETHPQKIIRHQILEH